MVAGEQTRGVAHLDDDADLAALVPTTKMSGA